MFEVFKTNVCDEETAGDILADLAAVCAGARVNFDLEDCDKVLRVVSDTAFDINIITDAVTSRGFTIEVLE